MKIGYVFENDAASPDVQSGRPLSILTGFEKAGNTVIRCFPMPSHTTWHDLVDRLLARWFGRKYLPGRTRSRLQWIARHAEQMLAGESCDFVFCPGSVAITYLRTSRPVSFSSDATLRAMVDYYPEFSNLGVSRLTEYDAIEQHALHRTDLLVYASQWAADSALHEYHVPPERVAVIPSGANHGVGNQPDEIECLIEERMRRPLELLFVGRSWLRKGGAICVEATRILNQRGVPAQLHIVGCQPVISSAVAEIVHIHGYLRASVPSERRALDRLFRRAHMLFAPSRAEAFGMATCDANAFGLPCISTATGGIPTAIGTGVNGVLLSITAGPAEYADAIAELWSNRTIYAEVARQSYQEFRQRLNWDTWTDSFIARIEPIVHKFDSEWRAHGRP